MQKNIQLQMIELTKKLLNYNFQYYNLNQSEISDFEYDKLLNQLKILEQEYPQFKQNNTPTAHVGGFVSKEFVQSKHLEPLYSLQDVFDYGQIQKFASDMSKFIDKPLYSCELKIDGVAIVLTYDNGFLVKAVTRGDGIVGEDVSANVKTIKSIPQVISDLRSLEIRGEIFMSHESFLNYNNQIMQKKVHAKQELIKMVDNLHNHGLNLHLDLEEEKNEIWDVWILEIEYFLKQHKALKKESLKFKELKKILNEKVLANPRNAASGSIRNLNTAITKQRNLDFLPYGSSQNTYQILSPLTSNSHTKTIDYFTSEFKFNKPTKCLHHKIEDVIAFIEEIGKMRPNLGFDIDGVVIKVDDISLHEKIGTTAKFPKWAIAYKYPPVPMKTKLLDVKYQVGKSGVITPVAILESVVVSGSVISKVTLHNKEYIKENDIQIGDVVTVHKSGDVIPQIIENVHTHNSQPIEFIKLCPKCQSTLDFEEVRVRCLNEYCLSKISQKVAYFANRNNMNIESLSIKNAQLLVEYGLVNDVLDLYKLTSEQLLLLPRNGEKSVTNLLAQIKKSKSANLSNLISSLAINSIGSKNAKYLANVFLNFETLYKVFTTNDPILDYLDDISQITIKKVQKYFELKPNLVQTLKDLEINLENADKNSFYEDNLKLLKIVNKLKELIPVNQLEEELLPIEFKEFNFTKKLLKQYELEIKKYKQHYKLVNLKKLENKFINNVESKNSFWGKTIVLTGTLENFKRKELQNILEAMGAKITGSVSKQTNFVIYGENAGSKLRKAQALEVTTISEVEVMKILKKEREDGKKI